MLCVEDVINVNAPRSISARILKGTATWKYFI